MLTERLSGFYHKYCVTYLGRPIGSSVMLGEWNAETGPQLYMIDPSGTSWGYYGCAQGKGKQNARSEIEKLKLSELSCEELVKEAARIMYVVLL